MTAPHFDTEHVTVWHGDCIDVMRGLPDASIDAIVTDPPYGLEFMGKDWDAPWERGTNVNADAGFSEIVMSDGFKRLPRPSYTGSTNPVCLNCGGKQRGRKDETAIVRACSCPDPRFPNVRAIEMRAFQDWCFEWATEALRVLKPGGHLLAFGGTRTFHRLTAGIEDAGFEIRDSIAWLYGSGFPKSLDVSKAIDKQLGTEGTYGAPKSAAHAGWIERGRMRGADSEGHDGWQRPSTNDPVAVDQRARQYEGGTEQARDWQGWGTALKPAFEPIVVARKPLTGTVAANVLQHGTGALNIDASRIRTTDVLTGSGSPPLKYGGQNSRPFHETAEARGVNQNPAGRWPANVVLDASQAAALDQQSGTLTSGKMQPTHTTAGRNIYGQDAAGGFTTMETYGDTGGASRFFKTVDDVTPRFMYTAKAGSDERPNVAGIAHPTVKSLDLMRWLVKLVTPKGGTILEPFAGSGTTVEAAVLEGFRCIAIEREADYLPLIMQRVSKPHAVGLDFGDWEDVS